MSLGLGRLYFEYAISQGQVSLSVLSTLLVIEYTVIYSIMEISGKRVTKPPLVRHSVLRSSW